MVEEFKLLVSDNALIVVIATIGLLGYVGHYWIKKKTLTGIALTSGLTVGAAYAALMGGLRVWLLCFNDEACKAAGIEWGYFFIAGIATVWMACQEIGNKHKDIV